MFGQGGGGGCQASVLHPTPVKLHTLQPFSWPDSPDKVRIVCQQAVMSGMLRASPPSPPEPCVSVHHPSCRLSKLSELNVSLQDWCHFPFLHVSKFVFFCFRTVGPRMVANLNVFFWGGRGCSACRWRKNCGKKSIGSYPADGAALDSDS